MKSNNNMKRMMLLGAALLLVMSASLAAAQEAVISNGSDPASMLNLRTAPDKGAQALGKFLSGTQVVILADAGDGWSQVEIGTGNGVVSGYVMTQYLSGSAQVDATRKATVVSPYGTQSVVLRDRPSNSYNAIAMLTVGDRVLIIGQQGEFRYVETDSGCVGCLLESELK